MRPESDRSVAAARSVLDRNEEVIRQGDRGGFSLYLHDAKLVRNQPPGFATGFDELTAEGAG